MARENSPYLKVTIVKTPTQIVGTQERFIFGENLSYSPAHCLTEHQPIGPINKARLYIYQAISKFRHADNKVERHEPTKEDFEQIE